MRAMKDSGIEWIGEIPREWDVVRIKYVLDKSEFGIKIGPFGSTLANRTLSSGEYSVYSQANLIANDFSETNHYIDKETFEDLRTYEVKPGDVCVSMMGTIGKCKEVPCGIREGIMDSHLIKIRLNGSRINPRFFEYVYDKDDSGICYTQMQYEKKGTIMDGLNTTIVKNLFLTLPPLLVQERIANYLDAKCAEIDALIVAKEKTNALLKERRQSIIYEAVTKGLDPTAAMKDSGIEWIGEIPEEWEIVSLKRLGTPATGSTPSKDNPDYWDGDIPWVSSKDMKTDYLIDSEDHITQQAVDECGLTVFQSGTVVFCVRSGILRHTFPVAVTKLPVTINQDLRALSLIDGVSPSFLLYYMRGMNDTIVSLYQKIGATVESIEMDWFLYFPVVLPPVGEQIKIIQKLDAKCSALDQLIEHNERTVKQLKRYRQSLIFEMVTGKAEV